MGSDGIAISADGFLYMTVNQLNRMAQLQGGEDKREGTYSMLRTPVDGSPVRLGG